MLIDFSLGLELTRTKIAAFLVKIGIRLNEGLFNISLGRFRTVLLWFVFIPCSFGILMFNSVKFCMAVTPELEMGGRGLL